MDKPIWNLLRIYAAVGEARSFTRAAAVLGLSQPAVSQSVARLEDTLGIFLIERNGRDFALTETGAAIYAETVAMRHASDRIAMLSRQSGARLEIGMVPNLLSDLLDEAFRLFHQRNAHIPVCIDTMSSMDVVTRLRATGRGVGICLLSHPLDDLDCRLLFSDDWSVFCGIEHPFFGREEISLDELRAEPFVAFTCARSGAGLEPMLPLSRDLGMGANIIATSTSAEEVRRLVVAGLGLGVMSWTTAREAHRAGLLWPIRITQQTLLAHVYLVRALHGADQAANDFADLLAELQALSPTVR